MSSKISVVDLEVFYRVGVTDAERARPQRLLLTVDMDFDFSKAAKTDDIAGTIDYFAVSQRLLKFGEKREWKLIEKLATDLADVGTFDVVLYLGVLYHMDEPLRALRRVASVTPWGGR